VDCGRARVERPPDRPNDTGSSLCAVRRNRRKGSSILAARDRRRRSFLDEGNRGRGPYFPDGNLGEVRALAASAAAADDTANPGWTGEIGRPAPTTPYRLCVEYVVGAPGRKSAQVGAIEQIHRSLFAGGHRQKRNRTGLEWQEEHAPGREVAIYHVQII